MARADLQDLWSRYHALRGVVVSSKPDQLAFVDETLADSQRYASSSTGTEQTMRESVAWLEGMFPRWGLAVPAPEVTPAPVFDERPVVREEKTALALAEEQARDREQESDVLLDESKEDYEPDQGGEVVVIDRRPRTQPAPAVAPTGASPAQVAARERQALGKKGAGRARASRIRETQRKAIAQAKAGSEPNYQEGGWLKMPNLVLDLIAVMPGPVVKAYMVACRLADADGTFEIGHQRMAEWIGGETRQHGERVMRRLVDAGLLTQRWRGGPGRVNGYRLASLARLDLETAKAVLALPLTESGADKHRRRLLEDATVAVASEQADATVAVA